MVVHYYNEKCYLKLPSEDYDALTLDFARIGVSQVLHNSSAKKKELVLAIILTMQEHSKIRKIKLFGTECSVCYRIPR